MGKAKLKTAVTAPANLTDNLQVILDLYKTEFNSGSTDTCVSSCISFFKKTKIPQNYLNVLGWLASIGAQEALAESSGKPVDTVAITTALILSTQYAAVQNGNAIAAAALITVVNDLASKYNLNLKSAVDIPNLIQYCQTNNITIPGEIQPLLNSNPTPEATIK